MPFRYVWFNERFKPRCDPLTFHSRTALMVPADHDTWPASDRLSGAALWRIDRLRTYHRSPIIPVYLGKLIAKLLLEINGREIPVSYTHLTLPTIYSV